MILHTVVSGAQRNFSGAARVKAAVRAFGRVSLYAPLTQEQINLRCRWSRIFVAMVFMITIAWFYQDVLWSQHNPTTISSRAFSLSMAIGAGFFAALIASLVFSVSGFETVTTIGEADAETLSVLVSSDKVASDFFQELHRMQGRVLVYREYQLLMRRAKRFGCHRPARDSRALIAGFLTTPTGE